MFIWKFDLISTLLLLCNTNTRAAILAHFSFVSVVYRWWRCWVCWRAKGSKSMGRFNMRALLLSRTLRIWCLRTIRTVICGIRLLTACWRWWWFILAWTSAWQVSTFHKFVIVDHPKRAEIILVTNETFMKRQICSNCILVDDHPRRIQLRIKSRTKKLAQFKVNFGK